MSNDPSWVCNVCGHKYGSMPKGHCATWHKGKCEVCLKDNVYVTEPRDFRHLPKLKKKKVQK